MEYAGIVLGLVLGLVAIGIAWFKKPKEVVRYEQRIKNIESNVQNINSVISNYEMKPKKK